MQLSFVIPAAYANGVVVMDYGVVAMNMFLSKGEMVVNEGFKAMKSWSTLPLMGRYRCSEVQIISLKLPCIPNWGTMLVNNRLRRRVGRR
ncbi:hypothetical protein Tco_0536208 [Tanacetum coccineum]